MELRSRGSMDDVRAQHVIHDRTPAKEGELCEDHKRGVYHIKCLLEFRKWASRAQTTKKLPTQRENSRCGIQSLSCQAAIDVLCDPAVRP